MEIKAIIINAIKIKNLVLEKEFIVFINPFLIETQNSLIDFINCCIKDIDITYYLVFRFLII